MQTLALRCPLCASDAAETLGVTGNFEARTDAAVVMQCKDCTAVYLSPAPADDLSVPTEIPAAILTRRRIGRWTRGLPPTAGILCFDSAVEARFSSLTRIDGRAWVVEHADLAFRSASRRGHDLILLTNSLEAAHDPERLLRQAAGLLADGGRLIVIVHNAGSSVFGAFGGRHWCGYRLPGSRQHFTKASLGTLAERVGLKLTESQDLFLPRAWVSSAVNWLRDWGASAGTIRLLTGRWLAPEAISCLIEGIAVMRGRGSMLVARLEKS